MVYCIHSSYTVWKLTAGSQSVMVYKQCVTVCAGYIGIDKDIDCIAALLKKNMVRRKDFSKTYWRDLSVARSVVERIFGVFFHNRYKLLSQWNGKSRSTFDEYAALIYCCIVIHNELTRNRYKIASETERTPIPNLP